MSNTPQDKLHIACTHFSPMDSSSLDCEPNCMPSFFNGSFTLTYFWFLFVYRGDFNLNNFEDGILSSAFMVGLLVASPIFASLAKR